MSPGNGNSNPSGTGSATSKQPDNYQSERALRKLAILMAIGPIAVVIYLLRGSQVFGQFFTSLGVGIVVAGASLLVGGLLGFLFGIPRTLQQSGPLKRPTPKTDGGDSQKTGADNSEPVANSSPARDYEDNTNLEQISDWLTKILVGVGLTQVRAIGEKLYLLGGEVSSALGSPNGNRTFALALIILNLVIGFLFSYLWTRLYLPGAFREADRQSRAIINQMEKAVKSMAQFGVGKAPEPARSGAMRKVLLEGSETIQPGPIPNDPWKNQFEGRSENNGRRLSGKVTPVAGRPDLYSILLSVDSTDPVNHPLSGVVQFFLHPTFTNQKPIVKVGPNGKAELNLVAWGAFTVGALADNGATKLELDLSELETAPVEFRSR
jgi:hypothetical protein